MIGRPPIIAFAVWGSLLLGGCRARTAGDSNDPAASSSPHEALSMVSRVLGKEHVPSSSPWASRAACQAALSTGEQRPGDSTVGALRIGTWNIRYFPDGAADGESELATDVEWLACAIALLDVDLLAMQELKHHDRARAASQELIRQLHALTGREYLLELARCDDPNMHRPGILYDSARVWLTRRRTLGQYEVESRCADETSPILAARVELEQRAGFELVVLHAPPGRKPAEQAARSAFWNRLASWLGGEARATDMMLVGDLNTWGCEGCREPLDSAHELRQLAETLRSSDLRSVPASEPCSFMLGQDAPLLDGFFVSSKLGEQCGKRAIVSGYCASAHCRDTFPEARSERALSDHCPLVLELSEH